MLCLNCACYSWCPAFSPSTLCGPIGGSFSLPPIKDSIPKLCGIEGATAPRLFGQVPGVSPGPTSTPVATMGATLQLQLQGACPWSTATATPARAPCLRLRLPLPLVRHRCMPLPLLWAGQHPGHGTTTTLGRCVSFCVHENGASEQKGISVFTIHERDVLRKGGCTLKGVDCLGSNFPRTGKVGGIRGISGWTPPVTSPVKFPGDFGTFSDRGIGF